MFDALPRTDPSEIFRQRDGIYAADLLIAGVCWLDLFTWLADHPADLPRICGSLEIAARPTDVMLTLFCAMDLLRCEDGVFYATELAREHLVRTSPFYLGPYLEALKDRTVCTDLVGVLRTDKPASWCSIPDAEVWERKMGEAAFAGGFSAAMDARARTLAPALARALVATNAKRLLDIAGGSGAYACGIVGAAPQISATVFEKPPVDDVARRMIAAHGYSDRVTVLAGDMFSDALPSGYDMHLFSNVLHDWDVPDVRALLQRSFAALAPGGWLVVHDAHLDADKAGPLPVAMYSVLLMHSTAGRCYSVREMEELLRACGCVDVTYAPTVADRSVIIGRKA